MTTIDYARLGFVPSPGVDSLSEATGLPERHVLPPDGHGVENHFAALYPANLAERQLQAFARPAEKFRSLLFPRAFRQELGELRQALGESELPAVQAASQQLLASAEDEQLLRLAVHLLHKV